MSTSPKSGLRAFFSFRTPASLFPPSAIISLTDDNSTFFLARPAAFGPPLPADGLSGQLWVGSGFGDDNLGRGWLDSRAEGELGCSDVPGWGDGQSKYHTGKARDGSSKTPSQRQANLAGTKKGVEGKQRRSLEKDEAKNLQQTDAEIPLPDEEDGTDDHLHHPLPDSQIAKQTRPGQSAEHDRGKDGSSQEHADIQSLQESAEISGKVVILSRGGCGFLEKVKWTQRRGGVALIVGDHTRGGNLLTMYAHGDTSNVTIPSLFTSYTTAHLLSSLMPLGRIHEPANAEDDDKPITPPKDDAKRNKNAKAGPTFSTTLELPKATAIPQPTVKPVQKKTSATKNAIPVLHEPDEKSWFRSLFGLASRSASDSGLPADSRRPPGSGHVNWIQSDNWNDEPRTETLEKKKATKSNPKSKISDSKPSSQDNFVIGVQDWRDPDLVPSSDNKPTTTRGKATAQTSSSKPQSQAKEVDAKVSASSSNKDGNTLKGGSITPGSGEYRKAGHGGFANLAAQQKLKYLSAEKQRERESQGWISRLFWGSDDYEDDEILDLQDKKSSSEFVEEVEFEDENGDNPNGGDEHEGLWVTLTPTTISTSPFFDTLLVLVVSPLITLTVVYALLLLRSRIRRRRWRAPKSVVDRLPVRTYHTMSCASSSSTSQIASPHTSDPSAPLLQHSPSPQRSGTSRTRPRSRTTSGIGELASSSLEQVTKKVEAKAPPRKKYNGKQVECVVCLEEYVDGQSKVMSLPCGHEFHAECM